MKPLWTTLLAVLLLTGCAGTSVPETAKNDAESVVSTTKPVAVPKKKSPKR